MEGNGLRDEEVQSEDAESDLLAKGVHLEVVEDTHGEEEEQYPRGRIVMCSHRRLEYEANETGDEGA